MLKNKNKNKNQQKQATGYSVVESKSKFKSKSNKLKSANAAKKSLMDFQALSLTGGSLFARRAFSKKKTNDFFNGLSGVILDDSSYGAVNPLNQRKKIPEVDFGCIEDAYAEKLKIIKPPARHPEPIRDKIRFILDFSLKTNTLEVISNNIFKFLNEGGLGCKEKKAAVSQLQLLFAPALGLKPKNCQGGINPGRMHYMQVLLK